MTAAADGGGEDARTQPANRYWETMRVSGVVPLSSESQLRLFTASKDGEWYIRLRLYRCQRVGREERWVPGNALLIVPVAAADALREALADAVAQVRAARPESGGDL